MEAQQITQRVDLFLPRSRVRGARKKKKKNVDAVTYNRISAITTDEQGRNQMVDAPSIPLQKQPRGYVTNNSQTTPNMPCIGCLPGKLAQLLKRSTLIPSSLVLQHERYS